MNPAAGGVFSPASPLVQFAPLIAIGVVFYFMILRPQQRQVRDTQQMQENLKVNDEIVTTGGLYGRVVKLADKAVVVEIAPKVQVKIERTAVTGLQRSAQAAAQKSGEEKSA